ncbi:aminotransferase class III-fold pyridoxal phosphate-dependent enzyme [Saccharomonospora sp. CUA-673]|uniref:aminotransferase class III-fold pyridoxal phosphate-dependent enzyme n=1 Tax=Saccharomonospora sp. CUA-673 TaxID=1904969 RepID=UPI001C9E5831|nr:aminotransferase class III-fold pyridoxal phosphate-dependent enzyme [Saccharomonospora sp. CUA-673]
MTHGDGVYLNADDGVRYLDGSSGAVAANLGHGNPRIADALAEQARTVSFAHRTQFRSRSVEELAERLGELAPGDLSWSLFSSSGSEANELAVRLALEYARARGHDTRTHFVSRALSYHGSTLGALSLTGQPRRRAGAEVLLHGFPALHAEDPFTPTVQTLRAELATVDPDRVAAVVTETVGGASSGALVFPDGYYETLRAWCDTHDVLWIADEVMCGFGRTGRWFAVEHTRAVPDLLVLGKGISGGYGPLAGVVATSTVAETVLQERGYVGFGHTYTNTPLGAAVGVAVVDEMERRDVVANARSADDSSGMRWWRWWNVTGSCGKPVVWACCGRSSSATRVQVHRGPSIRTSPDGWWRRHTRRGFSCIRRCKVPGPVPGTAC